MRKGTLLIGMLVLLATALAFTSRETPAVTHTYAPQGEIVTLDFRVHKFNSEGVEIALNNPQIPTFFIQFEVSMVGFDPVVTMAGLTKNSRLRGTASPQQMPDFPFLRDKEGRPVMRFSFENQLATGGQSGQVLRMTYRGIPVPLVETLVINEPILLPPALSSQFDVQGLIQFEPGRLELEGESFWIPIRVIHVKNH